jgi:hydrogenase 3 maturation protease
LASGEYDLEKELREWFRGAGRVVVVGVGNPIRMDDFVGMKVVQDLKGKVDAERVMLVESETVPEGYLQEITDFNPSHVLLIDAAIMGLKAGEARLVKPEQLTNAPAVSSHMLPLRIFCEYIIKTTKAHIALLLIEPKQTEFGEKMTHEIKTSARHLSSVLCIFLEVCDVGFQ